MDVKGRVALVTGAASGIGKSCAVELLNEGAMVSKKKKKEKKENIQCKTNAREIFP